jgi:fibronectin-binding autotransporter adhesin
MRPKAHRHYLIAACGPLFLTATISAQTVRTWDGGPAGNGTVLTTAANWSGDVLPASTGNTTATRHDAQWDGSVAGDLNLTFSTAFGGSWGVGLVMTGNQTGNLTLTSSNATLQNLRIVNSTSATTGGIQIASGAGALTIGAAGTSNPIQLVLGQGASALNYYFANSSNNTATIEENVTILKGGTHAASLIFSAGNWNVKGVVSDLGAGGLNVNAGAVTLSANNPFSAAVNINGGTLSISAANNLGTGTGAVRLGQTTTSGTLEFTGSSNATISRLMRIGNGAAAAYTGTGTITNIGTGVLTFDNATFNEVATTFATGSNRALTLSGNNTGNNTISGVIADNNPGLISVTKSGTGKWVLSGNNTFSNGVSIDEGTLVVGHDNALGNGTINLRADQSGEIARLQSNGTDRTITNAVTFGGAAAATANYLGGTGSGKLTLNGSVFWGSATKTYTVDGSTVEFGGAWTGNSTENNNGLNGTDVATSILILNGDRGSAAKEINIGNNLTVRANHANSFGSDNSEPLVVLGGVRTSVVELENDITLARTLDVQGRDAANANVALRNRSGNNALAITVGSGGTRYNIDSQAGTLTISSVGGLTGTRDLFVTGAGNVVLPNWNSRRDLTMNGAGTLTLSGNNTYTGNTTVSTGTLVLDNSGRLRFNIGATGVNNTLNGTGTATLNGGFIFNLASAGVTTGNSWNIVNVATLSEGYGGSFSVSSTLGPFTNSSGTWTRSENSVTYQFVQSTGVLSVISGGANYSTWAASFTDPVLSNTASTADPDNDGLINAIEYALGLDPRFSSPSPGVISNAGKTITFTKGAEAKVDPKVTYQIETSISLGVAPTPWAVNVADVTNGPDTISITFAAGPVKNFARLKITLAP